MTIFFSSMILGVLGYIFFANMFHEIVGVIAAIGGLTLPYAIAIEKIYEHLKPKTIENRHFGQREITLEDGQAEEDRAL